METTGGTGRLQGTTGIGFAIAERFLREGARVAVTGRDRLMDVNVRGYLLAPPGEKDRPESGDWPVPPKGRIGQARDVAAAAVFYASDEAEFITGTTLLVDGGMTAGYHQREHSPIQEIPTKS